MIKIIIIIRIRMSIIIMIAKCVIPNRSYRIANSVIFNIIRNHNITSWSLIIIPI